MKNTTDKTFSALPPVTLTLDPLTGLLSRNSFLEQVRIPTRPGRAKRLVHGRPLIWSISSCSMTGMDRRPEIGF